jgi:hypothetical protein
MKKFFLIFLSIFTISVSLQAKECSELPETTSLAVAHENGCKAKVVALRDIHSSWGRSGSTLAGTVMKLSNGKAMTYEEYDKLPAPRPDFVYFFWYDVFDGSVVLPKGEERSVELNYGYVKIISEARVADTQQLYFELTNTRHDDSIGRWRRNLKPFFDLILE